MSSDGNATKHSSARPASTVSHVSQFADVAGAAPWPARATRRLQAVLSPASDPNSVVPSSTVLVTGVSAGGIVAITAAGGSRGRDKSLVG